MLPRRIAIAASVCVLAGSAASAAAEARPLDDACAGASPSASLCIGGQKLAEAGAAVCRDGAGDGCAAIPAGHAVVEADLAAYRGSWLHRTAAFQFALGDAAPLRDAQWLGTHNSFNAPANGITLSRTDSNQQLTLTQQLDADIRSLELDLHFVPGTEAGLGSRVVRVCHGRGAGELHAGCTTESLFEDVLAEINRWLGANPGQVLLLYLEDHLGEPDGYAAATAALDAGLPGRVFGPAAPPSDGCRELPLGLSRADVVAAGRSVILVGHCRAGWGSHVFGWDDAHVESGDSTGYACTDDGGRLVRFFEDSTWLSATIDPGQTPGDHAAGSLTPDKVAAMTACGVNLLGLDQFDPNDGRVAASIWSWAEGQPDAAAGACAVQRADGRWASATCDGARPVACRTDGALGLAPDVTACTGALSAPRTGEENARLRALAGGAEVLLTL